MTIIHFYYFITYRNTKSKNFIHLLVIVFSIETPSNFFSSTTNLIFRKHLLDCNSRFEYCLHFPCTEHVDILNRLAHQLIIVFYQYAVCFIQKILNIFHLSAILALAICFNLLYFQCFYLCAMISLRCSSKAVSSPFCWACCCISFSIVFCNFTFLRT